VVTTVGRLFLGDQWHHGEHVRRAGGAVEREDAVFLEQLGQRLEGTRRNVTVVFGQDLDLAAVDPTRGVDLAGRDLGAERHAAADEGRGSCHDVDVADLDLGIADAGIAGPCRRRGQQCRRHHARCNLHSCPPFVSRGLRLFQ
jgi:hypothetical protein